MASPLIPAPLLSTLNVLLLERVTDGSFHRLGDAPPWVALLWPEAAQQTADLHPTDAFLFLEHFLPDAEAVWSGDTPGPGVSELWTEEDKEGTEWLLEAQAHRLSGRALLMLKFPTVAPEDIREVLQQSRELSLDHYQLRKEIDQREVLLHCLIHDLSTPLAAIRGSFRLMREENMVDSKGDPLVDIGLRQVEKVQRMVKGLLADFTAMQQPTPLVTQPGTPDLAIAVKDLVQGLNPIAVLKHVHFCIKTSNDSPTAWPVVGESTRLERVLFNLFENALRHAPPSSDIVVRLHDEGATTHLSIEDEGEGVPPALAAHLFRKFSQGSNSPGKVGLGLYFCRITIEGWGGTIGYKDNPTGGACFWFRLPKPV